MADVALKTSDQPPFLSTGPWLGWWVERLLKSLHGGCYWDPPSRVQALGQKVADVALRMSGLRVVSLKKVRMSATSP